MQKANKLVQTFTDLFYLLVVLHGRRRAENLSNARGVHSVMARNRRLSERIPEPEQDNTQED